MKYIEAQIIIRGSINRKKLVSIFGIQDASATRDIVLYSQTAPGRISYNHHVKEHQAMPDFQPFFFTDAGRWVEQAKAYQDAVHHAFGVITL